MMHTLSPLQFLPPHVIRLIINHVVGNSRLVFDGVLPNSEMYKALLKPLLWVSSNFRAVAYPLYCSYFKITIGGLLRSVLHKPPLSQTCSKLGHSVHHMAKELCIYIEEKSVYSGAALEHLSHKYYDECAFPLVRTFTLLLVSYRGQPQNESDDKCEGHRANVSAFVLWVKQMLPKVNEIRVDMDSYFGPDQACDHHFSDLVLRLYRLGTRIDYNCETSSNVPVKLRLSEIRNLVHITFRDGYGGHLATQLARQNAQMLQSLSIETDTFNDLDGLVQNPDGGYVMYPCLRTLKLEDCEELGRSKLPVFPGAVPFPFLRRLSIKLKCPFGDDILFRGNTATLESLELQTNRLIVSMLRQHNVFTPTSHPQLQYVSFGNLGILVPDHFATYAEGVRYILSIGPRAVVRKIEGVSSSDDLLPALSLPGDHSAIRVLSITSTILDIWQAMSLIESLPLLSDLHAPMPSMGTLPDDVDRAGLPAYMISTYAPMGERFRCWHLEHVTEENYTGSVICMMVLALVCPNFNYIAMNQRQRMSLKRNLGIVFNIPRFRPYTRYLHRLLFKGMYKYED